MNANKLCHLQRAWAQRQIVAMNYHTATGIPIRVSKPRLPHTTMASAIEDIHRVVPISSEFGITSFGVVQGAKPINMAKASEKPIVIARIGPEAKPLFHQD